jgi:hypothetical protein
LHEAIIIDSERAFTLKGVMQSIHPSMKLCGTTDKSHLDLSDELLTYVRSVLQDESPLAPAASLDEWSSLLNFLRANWIIPFVYRKIGSSPQECRPPETITDEMRQDFLISVVRSLHMERQLQEIIEALEEEGVRVLVLRGPALAVISICWCFRSKWFRLEPYWRVWATDAWLRGSKQPGTFSARSASSTTRTRVTSFRLIYTGSIGNCSFIRQFT